MVESVERGLIERLVTSFEEHVLTNVDRNCSEVFEGM